MNHYVLQLKKRLQYLLLIQSKLYFKYILLFTGSGILSRLGPQPGEVTSTADVAPTKLNKTIKTSNTTKTGGVFERLGKKLDS